MRHMPPVHAKDGSILDSSLSALQRAVNNLGLDGIRFFCIKAAVF